MVFKVAQPLSVQVLLNDRYPAAHAGRDVIRTDFQAIAGGLFFLLEVIQQGAVATAKVQHVAAGFDPLLDDFQIGSHARSHACARR
jgi:hypothetical protein